MNYFTFSRFQINGICDDILQLHKFQFELFPDLRAEIDPIPSKLQPQSGMNLLREVEKFREKKLSREQGPQGVVNGDGAENGDTDPTEEGLHSGNFVSRQRRSNGSLVSRCGCSRGAPSQSSQSTVSDRRAIHLTSLHPPTEQPPRRNRQSSTSPSISQHIFYGPGSRTYTSIYSIDRYRPIDSFFFNYPAQFQRSEPLCCQRDNNPMRLFCPHQCLFIYLFENM